MMHKSSLVEKEYINIEPIRNIGLISPACMCQIYKYYIFNNILFGIDTFTSYTSCTIFRKKSSSSIWPRGQKARCGAKFNYCFKNASHRKEEKDWV